MKNILLQEDVKLVEAKIKQFENRTGCELLVVVAKSSDPYPAASLRFGIFAGFVLSLIFSYYFEFHHSTLWPVSFFVITLFMIWLGRFDAVKCLALSDWETARESKEKAIELFHTLGTSKVSHKTTAMIMISTMEKAIHVLVDEKLKTKLAQNDLDALIALMQTHFKDGNMAQGLSSSIQQLEEKILSAFQGKISDVNPSELSDTIHFL